MSRTNVWWPIYPADFSIDTQSLSLEEKGAYVVLCNAYWRNQKALTDDDAAFARLLGVSRRKWRNIKQGVAPLFVVKNGKWSHEHLDSQMRKVATTLEKRRRAAQTRWAKERGSDAHALHVECNAESESDITRVFTDVGSDFDAESPKNADELTIVAETGGAA